MENSRTLDADIIASSTSNVPLDGHLLVSDNIVAREGFLVAVRILDEKSTYNQVELRNGDFVTLKRGKTLIGTLGERQALRGYSGIVPRQIRKGDILHVLNMGGIIGLCQSDYPPYGPATRAEVIGAVMIYHDDTCKHASISDFAIEWYDHLPESAPLIAVTGTCMNVGKTYAATAIIERLSEKGLRVAAAKLTGASLLRDTKAMKDKGAVACTNFSEAGLVSTTHQNVVTMAKGLIRHLNSFSPDVIVLEFGDGVIGSYGVDSLLMDKEIQQHIAVHVTAAQDLTGCWALDGLFRTQYNRSISLITGPVTDNIVGIRYISKTLGIRAANAQQQPDQLASYVLDELLRNTNHKFQLV